MASGAFVWVQAKKALAKKKAMIASGAKAKIESAAAKAAREAKERAKKNKKKDTAHYNQVKYQLAAGLFHATLFHFCLVTHVILSNTLALIASWQDIYCCIIFVLWVATDNLVVGQAPTR